jgi:hypothetical protein
MALAMVSPMALPALLAVREVSLR